MENSENQVGGEKNRHVSHIQRKEGEKGDTGGDGEKAGKKKEVNVEKQKQRKDIRAEKEQTGPIGTTRGGRARSQEKKKKRKEGVKKKVRCQEKPGKKKKGSDGRGMEGGDVR